MVHIRKLDAILPATSIEAEVMAELCGIVPGETLNLFEPPAGWLEPAVDPLHALVLAERAAGVEPEIASAEAARAVGELLSSLPPAQRPWLLTWDGACQMVAVSTLAAALRARDRATLADYLTDSAEAAADAPVFRGYTPFGRRPVSLRTVAARRVELGMMEFCVGVPMYDALTLLAYDYDVAERLGAVWYEETRPRIEALSREIGVELFHYGDPGDELDDDYAHRYLVLDYLCYLVPTSPYVLYLAEASDAVSVAALRKALLDAKSYTSDPQHGRYTEVEPSSWLARFDFDAGPRRTTGVVVGGPEALELACAAIRTRLGQRVVVIAGEGSPHADLVDACQRARTDWRIRAGLDDDARDALIADLDELWLFEALMPMPPANLPIHDPLLLAYRNSARRAGIPVTSIGLDGCRQS